MFIILTFILEIYQIYFKSLSKLESWDTTLNTYWKRKEQKITLKSLFIYDVLSHFSILYTLYYIILNNIQDYTEYKSIQNIFIDFLEYTK